LLAPVTGLVVQVTSTLTAAAGSSGSATGGLTSLVDGLVPASHK
jgi:hypothetical protein